MEYFYSLYVNAVSFMQQMQLCQYFCFEKCSNQNNLIKFSNQRVLF